MGTKPNKRDNASSGASSAAGQQTTPLYQELAIYRRDLPRLLQEGQGGRYAVIKGGQIYSIWDRQRDALQSACECFGLEPFAVKKIDPRDVAGFALLDAQQEA